MWTCVTLQLSEETLASFAHGEISTCKMCYNSSQYHNLAHLLAFYLSACSGLLAKVVELLEACSPRCRDSKECKGTFNMHKKPERNATCSGCPAPRAVGQRCTRMPKQLQLFRSQSSSSFRFQPLYGRISPRQAGLTACTVTAKLSILCTASMSSAGVTTSEN